MKRISLYLVLVQFFFHYNLLGQLSCSDLSDIATAVGIEAPGFNVNVVNHQFTGGTCARIEYNGQEVNGSSSFDLKVDVGISADKIICGLVDGTVPSPLDLINIDGTFRCEFNILNVEGYIEAYAITAYPNPPSLEKKVKGTVNRTDEIQIYSPVATTIELPLQVHASLAAMQSFCPTNPDHSIAEAKAKVSASLGGTTVDLTSVAKVSGGFLDNKIATKSQVVSVNVPAGVTTLTMQLKGEISAKSRVRGLSQLGVVVCGSNAGANVGQLNVGNFTGPNGTPLPEDVEIIGLSTGINYSDPENPIPCIQISPPNIVVENDTCSAGLGTATVTPNSDDFVYEWSNGVIDTMTTNLFYGDHYLTVTDSTGCYRDFAFFVDDPEAPPINLPSVISIEENETITLMPIDSNGTGLTYLWSTGETTETIDVNSTGTYQVTITSALGCIYEEETLVQEVTPIDFSPCLSANYLFTGNAEDLSGNANHATVFGATLTEDRNGKIQSAYYFDGIDDYIELPSTNETQPEQGLTFTAWFKSDSLPVNDWGAIVSHAGLGYEAALSKINPGYISTSLDLQAGNNVTLNSQLNRYADNSWHSLAITFDANTGIYRVFINGNLNEEILGNLDSIAYQTGTPITIGRKATTNSNYFKGVIDDVRIFNCALNEDELSFLFTQQPDFSCYQEIYFEDFEGTIGPEWSSSNTYQLVHPLIDTANMLGRFLNNTTSLTLENTPVNTLVSVCFDLFIFDTWGGNDLTFGPDLFSVDIPNNRSLVYTNFSNVDQFFLYNQSYPSNYNSANFSKNPFGTGAEIAEDLNGFQTNPGGSSAIDSKYRICRVFHNTEDTLQIDFSSTINQGITDESWAIDDVSVSMAPSYLNTLNETVTCDTDGSFTVTIPFTPNSDNGNYMAFEQVDNFGDIDTVYFTDDGSISSITMGPYSSGRNYSIVVAPVGFTANCFPVISDSTDCFFNEPCNLDVNFQFDCLNDSLTVTGTITGGMPPYSIYGNGYITVLLPGEGDTFTYSVYDCSTPVEVVVTDINMCTYQDSTMTHIESPYETFCLKDVALYPNPVEAELFVSVSDVCGEMTIKLYNAIGQLVQSNSITDGRRALNVSSLETGIYFISLEHEQGSLVKKFVKM